MLEQDIKKKVHLSIEEIKVPEIDATLIAESIAEQISRRVAYRRAMKHAVQQAMRRAPRASRFASQAPRRRRDEPIGYRNGRPRAAQTLRADIDFGIVHAHTTYGRIGVKVWVYRGDVLPTRHGYRGDSAADLRDHRRLARVAGCPGAR